MKMVDLQPGQQPQRAPSYQGPEVLQQPPITNTQNPTVSKSTPFTPSLAGDVGNGTFFSGTILNLDTANTIDAVFTDQTTPSSLPIPPGYALNLTNLRCSALTIQVDLANSAATVAFIFNGRVTVALTPEAAYKMLEITQIFFSAPHPPASSVVSLPSYQPGTGVYTIPAGAGLVSIGFGIKMNSMPLANALIWATLAIASSTTTAALSTSASLALYRSIVSIPAAGSLPNAGDVRLWLLNEDIIPAILDGGETGDITVSGAGPSLQHVIPVNYFDTGLTVGTTYYYYFAAGASYAAGSGVIFQGAGEGDVGSNLIVWPV